MTHVYRKTQGGDYPSLWTVGYYTPAGEWVAYSDHDTEEAAARRVHWLNGGRDDEREAA